MLILGAQQAHGAPRVCKVSLHVHSHSLASLNYALGCSDEKMKKLVEDEAKRKPGGVRHDGSCQGLIVGPARGGGGWHHAKAQELPEA